MTLPMRSTTLARIINRGFSLGLLAGGLALAALWAWLRVHADLAWDFAVDWTAARALLQGASLYDLPRLQALVRQWLPEPLAHATFLAPLSGYDTAPGALLCLPFTGLPFVDATWVYRVCLSLAFLAALAVLCRLLPRRDRALTACIGLLLLLVKAPVGTTLQTGQVDAWIVLALACAVWAAAQERWMLAGAAIVLAAGLKLTPAVVLLPILWYRRWRVLLGAGAAAALVATTLVIGRPDDWYRWATEVVPALGGVSCTERYQGL